MVQIQQGTDANERVGLEIQPMSLSLKAIVASHTGATSSCFTRVLVFQSHAAETAPPSDVSLIQDYLGAGSSAMIVYNHRNWASEPLYSVLLDDVITTSAYGQYRDIVEKEYLLNLKKANPVMYLDASTAISGNKGGRIYVYFLSGETMGNGQTVTYHARLTYSDA